MAPLTSRLSLGVVFFAVVATVALKWRSGDNNSGQSIIFISQDFFHEGADWDAENNRVLLSAYKFSGGGGLFEVRLNGEAKAILKAENVAAPKEAGGGPLWVGVRVDAARHRVLVVHTTSKRDYSGLAAYDLNTWELLFLKDLAGPDSPSFADDVAVDDEGNAYVTDAGSTRIWKVSPDGSQSFVLTDSPLLKVYGPLPFDAVSLNGIVYHPSGYLLVDHTLAGALFKISLDGASVQRVNVTGSLILADGMALLSPDQLVVGTLFGTKLLVSSDGWESAEVVQKYLGPLHRLGTSVFVKDGKPYTSFGLGKGIREFTSTIREALFY